MSLCLSILYRYQQMLRCFVDSCRLRRPDFLDGDANRRCLVLNVIGARSSAIGGNHARDV